MLALIAAAAIAAPPAAQPQRLIDNRAIVMRERACGLWHGTPVDHPGPKPQVKRLGDLPRAHLEIAVLRLDANGCQQPVIVRYDVEGDGRFAGGAGGGK